MKDPCFVYYGNPCVTQLADPSIQDFDDATAQGAKPCMLYPSRKDCSPPEKGCIKLAGAAMARHVLQFYSEATDETLAMEREEFRKRAPLPPDRVKAYVSMEGQQLLSVTDPDEVVTRVWDYARAVLDLKPGERIFRSSEDSWAPPLAAEFLETMAKTGAA